MHALRIDVWTQFSVGQEASIGFLRQAEIKHGRVAMAAFVGYIVQSNGIYWPWALTTSGITHADISAAGSPPAQWDALPTAAKVQILLFIGALRCSILTVGGGGHHEPARGSCLAASTAALTGASKAELRVFPFRVRASTGFLETCSESTYILEQSGTSHYMKGGVPGKFPSIKGIFPHPIPFDLFDPFGLSKNKSAEAKEKGLRTEINNGRLAQLGIMAFVAEAKVPGSVPFLTGKIAPYSGEIMAPFSATDASLPFVSDMITYKLPF